MGLFNENIENLINDVKTLDTIDRADIPNIDLYMDQITNFMEDNLESFKRNPSDKILTKTMINNYAKAKLFPPPVKKKYNKNHIMLLIIIYHLKTILSINDIKKLLKPLTEEIKLTGNAKSLEVVYDYFVYFQKNNDDPYNLENKYALIDNKLSNENIKNKETLKLIILVLLVSIQANTQKRFVEKVLDTFFNE